MYETLLINYGSIQRINFTEDRHSNSMCYKLGAAKFIKCAAENTIRIIFELVSPPLLADQPLNFSVANITLGLEKPNVIVEISHDDVRRFIKISKLRGLVSYFIQCHFI